MRKFLLLALLITPLAWAKKFTTQYCEFELPTGWDCSLEGSEWTCSSTNKDRQKEAIIILAAKIRGSEDDLDHYLSYLKKSKSTKLPSGQTQVSDPKYAEIKVINDHKWVDSLHLASEIPGFYTRYVGTVKEDLGIVVTFSVAKDHYDNYQTIIENVVKTLRVFRQKAVSAADFSKVVGVDASKQGNLLSGAGDFIPDATTQRLREAGGPSGTIGDLFTSGNIVIILLLAGGALFYFRKIKGRKKGKK